MTDLPCYVLDSFALLAYLENERGGERVRAILEQARRGECRVFMSLINLGEVAYIVERERGLSRAQETLAAVEELPLSLLPVTQEVIFNAAHLKARHRMSFADTFAAAGAVELGATLLTGDPEFKTVQADISIEWLQR